MMSPHAPERRGGGAVTQIPKPCLDGNKGGKYKEMDKSGKTTIAALGMIFVIVLSMGLSLALNVGAVDNMPANKFVYSTDDSPTYLTEVNETQDVVLFKAKFKSSTTADYLITFASEVALYTNTTVKGTQIFPGVVQATSAAGLQITIKVDGVPLPPILVTYCDRIFGIKTNVFTDPAMFLAAWIQTKSTHSFMWVAMNLGNGEHEVQVIGHFYASSTNIESDAWVEAGYRILTLEPIKANKAIYVPPGDYVLPP